MPTELAEHKGAWKSGETYLGFVQVGVPQAPQPADTVKIITITQNAVSAQYSTLSGNNPGANNNTMFLWQTSSPSNIPTSPAYASAAVPLSFANAAYAVPATITQSPYLIGYAVGASIGNIVATSWVAGTTSPPPGTTDFAPSVSLYLPPTSYSVSFLYSLPPGSLPLKNNHWVGIYTGGAALFGIMPDAGFMAVPGNIANTSVTLQGNALTGGALTAGATYTAAYFAGGWNSTTPTSSKLNSMCMAVTFVVPNS